MPPARRPRHARLDARSWTRSVRDAARAPYLLLHKVRKVLRTPGRHADELDPDRWFCPVRSASGAPTRIPGDGPHVVFVGKGFGELRLLARIDGALRERRPSVRTTWSGQLPEFFAGAAAVRPGQPTVALPFDVLPAVQWWLSRLAPDVVVFVERFWYPSLLHGAASAGARCLAVNAIGWHHPPPAGWRRGGAVRERRALARCVAGFGFQSEDQHRRAAPFLGPDAVVRVTGNVKLDVEDLPPDERRDAALAAWLAGRGGRPLLAAASTRKGDEPFVLEAFLAVRRDHPCALLIAPREMHRVPGVLDLLRRAGLAASRRTAPAEGADVFVLDTVGELAATYPHVAAAFIGGTLRHLGQNFVEPLRHGVPVAMGRADVLLRPEQDACVAAGLGTSVDRPADLAAHWRRVLSGGDRREVVRGEAERFLAGHRGALGRTLDLLLPAVDGVR